MTSTSLSFTATLCSTSSSCCLAVLLPGLSCPDPVLADTLVPDPLSLGDEHHQGAALAIAPHPDVHLAEPAAVAPIQLCVCRGASKTLNILEAVRNCGVTVAAYETRNAAASCTRYYRACTTQTVIFWLGNFYLENYDVS
jgi:hypothetical protein